VIVAHEPVELLSPLVLELDGTARLISAEPVQATDVADHVAEGGGQRAGRVAKIALGGERLAIVWIDLLQPLGQEVPADHGPEQHQKKGPEETRIVSGRREQRRAPFKSNQAKPKRSKTENLEPAQIVWA